jgi:hypothetical protein
MVYVVLMDISHKAKKTRTKLVLGGLVLLVSNKILNAAGHGLDVVNYQFIQIRIFVLRVHDKAGTRRLASWIRVWLHHI